MMPKRRAIWTGFKKEELWKLEGKICSSQEFHNALVRASVDGKANAMQLLTKIAQSIFNFMLLIGRDRHPVERFIFVRFEEETHIDHAFAGGLFLDTNRYTASNVDHWVTAMKILRGLLWGEKEQALSDPECVRIGNRILEYYFNCSETEALVNGLIPPPYFVSIRNRMVYRTVQGAYIVRGYLGKAIQSTMSEHRIVAFSGGLPFAQIDSGGKLTRLGQATIAAAGMGIRVYFIMPEHDKKSNPPKESAEAFKECARSLAKGQGDTEFIEACVYGDLEHDRPLAEVCLSAVDNIGIKSLAADQKRNGYTMAQFFNPFLKFIYYSGTDPSLFFSRSRSIQPFAFAAEKEEIDEFHNWYSSFEFPSIIDE